MFGKNVENERIAQRWFKKLCFGEFIRKNQFRGGPEGKMDNDELKIVMVVGTY